MPIKGTYYNATLGAAPTTLIGPTGSPPYLGGIISAPFLNPTFTGSSPATATYATLTLTAGVYILNATGFVAAGGAVFHNFSSELTDGTTSYATSTPYALSGNTVTTTYTWSANITAIVALTTTKTINFKINIYLGSGTITNNSTGFVYNAVRIGQTLGTAPTNNTLTLGSLITSTALTTSLPTGGQVYSLNSIALTLGSWILISNVTFNSFSNTYAAISISSTSAIDQNSEVVVLIVNGAPVLNLTRAFTITSNQTWYLLAQCGSANTVNYVNFYAMRIG